MGNCRTFSSRDGNPVNLALFYYPLPSLRAATEIRANRFRLRLAAVRG